MKGLPLHLHHPDVTEPAACTPSCLLLPFPSSLSVSLCLSACLADTRALAALERDSLCKQQEMRPRVREGARGRCTLHRHSLARSLVEFFPSLAVSVAAGAAAEQDCTTRDAREAHDRTIHVPLTTEHHMEYTHIHRGDGKHISERRAAGAALSLPPIINATADAKTQAERQERKESGGKSQTRKIDKSYTSCSLLPPSSLLLSSKAGDGCGTRAGICCRCCRWWWRVRGIEELRLSSDAAAASLVRSCSCCSRSRRPPRLVSTLVASQEA